MASTALSQSLSSTLNAQCAISHKSSIGSTPSLSLNRSLPLKSHPFSIRFNTNRISFISKCAPTDNEPAAAKSETPIELRYPSFPTVVDINQIMDILPHRYPFLLVDRVIEYNPGVSAVAIKNVTINDQFFNGHFPGRPIMPGVLMIENMMMIVSYSGSGIWQKTVGWWKWIKEKMRKNLMWLREIGRKKKRKKWNGKRAS